jgi:hypothetical protein
MRAWGVVLLGLSVSIVCAGPARAGIYNPGESSEGAIYPDFIDGPPGKNFRDVLLILRTIPVNRPEVDNPVRRRYVFMDELATKYPASSLKTVEDKLQASAVFLRRRKFAEAELLLRPIATSIEARDNIPIQSNFATTLHMKGDLVNAVYTLRDAIEKHWPQRWDELPSPRRKFLEGIGWSQHEYEFFRDCDTYYLKLLQLRLKEQREKKAGKGIVQPPDALFNDGKDPPTPVKFVNEKGEFVAGRKVQLPERALPIVQQLNVWLPDDLRLYWLLGELYNAQGTEKGIKSAHQIFTDLQGFADLSKAEPIAEDVKSQLKERVRVLNIAAGEIRAEEEKKLFPVIDDKPASGLTADWRTVAISFGAGFMLALFVFWQVREIRRRRLARG